MTISDKDSTRQNLLNCPACGFHYKIGAAAKPVCPECNKNMDLASGTVAELEELITDLDKTSMLLRGFSDKEKRYKLTSPDPDYPDVEWTVAEILEEINRDHSGDWTDYDESDWREGLRECVYYYTLVES